MKKILLLLKAAVLFMSSIGFCAEGRVMVVADNISYYLKETVAPFDKEHAIHVLVRAGDTETALDLLLREATDIAAITRELYPEEKKRYSQLIETPVASDALVFVVHPSNPLNNLTKSQVQSLYTKKNIKWRELIGYGYELSEKTINPMSKTQHNGSFKAFMRYFNFESAQEKGKSIYFQLDPDQKNTQRVSSVVSDQAAVAQLAVRPESIAFVSLTALSTFTEGKDFKVLAYNKVKPSVKTTFNRSYPLTYRLTFVMNAQNENPEAQAYLDWILEGEGQDIFRDFGLAPINLKTKIIQTTSSFTQFRRY